MDKYKNKYRIPSARAQWWDYGWNGAYYITICTQNREHFFGEIEGGKMKLSPLGAIADVLWHEIPHHSPYVELGDFVVMPNHIHGILILNKPNWVDPNQNAGGRNTGVVGNVDAVDVGNTGAGGNADAGVVETLHATSLRQRQQQPQWQPQPQREYPQRPQQRQSDIQSGSGSGSGSESKPESQSKPNLEPKPQFPKNEKMSAISPKSNTISTIIRSYKSAVTKHANRLELDNGWQPRFHDHIIRNDAEYQLISDYIVDNISKWQDDRFYAA